MFLHLSTDFAKNVWKNVPPFVLKDGTKNRPVSKFCAIRDRSKIIEPLLESYPQVLVTTSLNGFTSYLLAIVRLTLLLYKLLLVIMLV